LLQITFNKRIVDHTEKFKWRCSCRRLYSVSTSRLYYADKRATGNLVSYGSFQTAPKMCRNSSLENTWYPWWTCPPTVHL